MCMIKADIVSCNYGPIAWIVAKTARGAAWMRANIASVDTSQPLAHVFVEHRYIIDILVGALRDGLTLQDETSGCLLSDGVAEWKHYIRGRLTPLKNPLGDAHHVDAPMTASDVVLGDTLAYYMGDLFIDSQSNTPAQQWQSVARALRIHGLQVVNAR